MKSTAENLEPTRVKLTVEADYAELQPQLDKAYKEIAQQVNIPGFRPGHVPARVIDQRFGRGAVIEQAVNEALPALYSQALAENNIRPLAQPEVDVVEVPATEGEPGGTLRFTAEVDHVPAFEIPEFADMVVEVEPAQISEEKVQAELDDLRGRFATLKPLERPAQDGDYLTLDLTATVDGEEIDSLNEISYELGSASMVEGQDEALAGKSAGDEVSFTSEVRGGEYAGSQAQIEVKLLSVKERELPEVDDDFAQMVSEFDTAEELLEDVRAQVAKAVVADQALEARDNLLEQLLERTEILLPAATIDAEAAERTAEDADEETAATIRAGIEKDIRQQIFLENLAEKLQVQVGQQELLDFMFQAAQNFGMDINQMFQDQAQVQNMVGELARTKALVSVLRQATVQDTNGEQIDISAYTADPAEAEAEAAAAAGEAEAGE